jgi:hypothetical protein
MWYIRYVTNPVAECQSGRNQSIKSASVEYGHETRNLPLPFGPWIRVAPSLQVLKRNNSGLVLYTCMHSSRHIMRIDCHHLQQFELPLLRQVVHTHRRYASVSRRDRELKPASLTPR